MACSCQSKRQKFEVVTKEGKVAFTSASKPTAQAVAKRYPGSTVRDAAKPGVKTTKA
ncbi:hypothetical protein [Streptomyces sp. Iso 434]|uniref:hypothetical protein n=1 Tax=Streptomyces sp. Iso 434 TaxID=3062272 RepID=UPI0039808D12